ncbi:deoxyribodipyrimidine photo-lyase [Corynebacterium lactis]|uniref:cryptochrome/photolyase family protein n=1 Tax=Corynebacterium lactis TaxID=1231000 RepID=UPI00316AEABF
MRAALVSAGAGASAGADAGSIVLVHTADPSLYSPARLVALAAAVDDLRQRTQGRVVSLLGEPSIVLPPLVKDLEAVRVVVQRAFEPTVAQRQEALSEALQPLGAQLELHGGAYAVDPGTIVSGAKTPYKVFTPFSKAWKVAAASNVAASATAEGAAEQIAQSLSSALLDSESLYCDNPLAPLAEKAAEDLPPATLSAARGINETEAWRRWSEFVADGLTGYETDRDRPDFDGTSRMSAQLAFGTIHPSALLADISSRVETRTLTAENADKFISELAWREFYADQLFHRPEVATDNADRRFDHYRWHESESDLSDWRNGVTGFPIVDAGMRQLAQTGWMHNRVRMIVASFLVKDLHLRWQDGAKVFRQRLLDYSPASNQLSWQWCAGSGFDASPFFRVFNPARQGRKFDPHGDYVRHWVPELAEVPGAKVHDIPDNPGMRPPSYPAPMVHHDSERKEALRRFEQVKGFER